MDLTESEARVFEVVRVTGSGGVAHVCEFALVTLGTHVQQLCGHGGVEDEVPVEESVWVGMRKVSSCDDDSRDVKQMATTFAKLHSWRFQNTIGSVYRRNVKRNMPLTPFLTA